VLVVLRGFGLGGRAPARILVVDLYDLLTRRLVAGLRLCGRLRFGRLSPAAGHAANANIPYPPGCMIDRGRLSKLTDRERQVYRGRNPRSLAAYQSARHLFGRVPMTWMNKSAGEFPLTSPRPRGRTSRTSSAMTSPTLARATRPPMTTKMSLRTIRRTPR
jgi:hypothetical protein